MRPPRAGADISSPCIQSRLLPLGRGDLADAGDGAGFRPAGVAGAGLTVVTVEVLFPAGRDGHWLSVPVSPGCWMPLRQLVTVVVGEVLVDGAGGLGQGGLRVGPAVDVAQRLAE